MSLSNYAEIKLLDHVLGTAFSQPSMYIALSTTDPLEDGSGISEPSGGAYARKAFSDWSQATARSIENLSTIQFEEATANWGELTHFAIFDAATSGNMLAHGEFTTPRTITSGKTARFLAGDFVFSFLAGGFTTHLANALLDHLFGGTAYTQPTIYAGLSTADPGDDGSGLSEPSGGGYARVAVPDWDGATSGSSSNTNAINFPDATGSWGTISHTFLSDAATGGNVLTYGSIASATAVNNGDTMYFGDGSFTITLD